RDERLELTALALRDRGVLWRHTVRAFWVRKWDEPRLELPLIATPDGGRADVIVPTGDVSADGSLHWVGLEGLGGATRGVRWQRRLVQEYKKGRELTPIHRFVVGPDLDGDGRREIFVVSSGREKVADGSRTAETPVFYVDALSGADGHSLWWFRQPLPKLVGALHSGLSFNPLRWWQTGPDGWPQLVVSRRPLSAERAPRRDRQPATYVLSAGTGRLWHTVTDLPEPEVADLDGDGLPELFSFRPDRAEDWDGGGKLQVIRGRSPEAWRRPEGGWVPAQDWGDGFPALLTTTYHTRHPAGVEPRQRVTAISSRDGGVLWHYTAQDPSNRSSPDRLLTPPLPQGDLDGDGVPDVLSLHPTRNLSDKGREPGCSPLEAISGKTGRRLWTAGLQVKLWQGAALLECHDLDGDGRPKVLLSGISGLEEKEGSIPIQFWLAVLSGRDG